MQLAQAEFRDERVYFRLVAGAKCREADFIYFPSQAIPGVPTKGCATTAF